MLKGQMSIFEDKLIKKTNKYEVAKHGNVYRIHFYDKGDKCRVTKNFDYVKRFL